MKIVNAARRAACLVAMFGLFVASPAHARWPGIGDTFRYVEVSDNTNDELGSISIPDGSGGVVIVWKRSYLGTPIARHLGSDGRLDTAWPADGRQILNTYWSVQQLCAVSDGAGGVIVAWLDDRAYPVPDVVAQRVRADGTLDPAWPANGVVLCAASGDRTALEMVSDGAGGAIVAWVDVRSGLLDLYAQRVRVTGVVDPAWPADGRLLCASTAQQMYPTMTTDGRGGAIVAWCDLRSGTGDIYAQHVWSNGTLDSAWPALGQLLCNATGNQTIPEIASDGAYGAIVVWEDGRAGTHTDVYAQHVLAAGTVDPAWTANGVALCTAANNQQVPLVVSDGSGGAIASWLDHRNSPYVECGVYAQRVRASGSVDPAWPANGRLLHDNGTRDMQEPRLMSDDRGGAILGWTATNTSGYLVRVHHVLASGLVDTLWSRVWDGRDTYVGDLQGLSLASDGAGGVIYSWSHPRYSSNHDIHALRVDRWGAFSGAAWFSHISDQRGDQGGIVYGSFNTSELNYDRSEFMGYRIWRQVPAAAALARIASGEPVTTSSGTEMPGRTVTLMRAASGAPSGWWEPVYEDEDWGWHTSLQCWLATTRDSLPGSNPCTKFMIESWRPWGGETQRWFSDVDSAYSVDNIPPGGITDLHGSYSAGTTTLTWRKVATPDLQGYCIHRLVHVWDLLEPSNLVAVVQDTTWADHSGAPWYYVVRAIDIHGNPGMSGLSIPDGTLDVGDRPGALALSAPSPNPARGATSLRLTLPRAAAVNAAVYDQQGRRVRELVSRTLTPGGHVLDWDGRDAGGRDAASGLYFVRVGVDGEHFTRRVALIR